MKKIGLIFCLLLLTISAVYSIDIEIGTGTTTTNVVPLNGYYNYIWSNFVINSNLIGMEVGITQIQFNVGNEPIQYKKMLKKKIL